MPQHAMYTEQLVGRLVAYWGNIPQIEGDSRILGEMITIKE